MLIDKNKLINLVLLLLTAILLATYLYKIDTVPFVRLDDGNLFELSETFAYKGFLGSRMMDTGHNENLHYHVHPPLYYLINGFIFRFFQPGIIQSRSVSLICSFLIIITCFVLLNIFLKNSLIFKDFLILSILFLSNPLYFVLARSTRPEMLALLISLQAILCYYLFHGKKHFILLISSGLFCGLALTTHIYTIFAYIYIISLLLLNDTAKKIKLIIIFNIGFILPVILYLLWIMSDPKSFYYETFILRNVKNSFYLGNIINKYLYFFSNYKTLAPSLLLITLIFIYYLYGRPLLRKIIKDNFVFIFLPLLIFLGIFIFIPVMNEYYYLFPLTYICCFTISVLKKHPRKIISLFIALYVAVNIFGLAIYWNKYKNYNYYGYTNKILAHLPSPGNFALLGSPSLYPGLKCYTFYAFINYSIINPDQTYEGFKNRIKELQIKYVVYQEYNAVLYSHLNYLKYFLANDCKLISRINDRYYGSEGVKEDNFIDLYTVK